MQKLDIRQIFARNVAAAIEKSVTVRNQSHLAEKAGISSSHMSEVLRGITSITIDLVNDIAVVLGMQPWELLADSETTRQTAMAKMLWRDAASNEKVEEHYKLPPAAPKQGVARPPKKPARRPPRSDASPRTES